MAKLSDKQWRNLRARYEVGASVRELASRYRVSTQLINRKIKEQGWLQDSQGLIDERVSQKILAYEPDDPPVAKELAIEKEADRIYKIKIRHRDEWLDVKDLWQDAIKKKPHNLDDMKFAKLVAETVRIQQEGERKSWGIKDTSDEENVLKVEIIRK